MRASEWTLVVTFAFLTVLAWIRPLGVRARLKVMGIGVGAGGLMVSLQWLDLIIERSIAVVIRDSAPAALMMVCYWQAGLFFSAPNPKLQRRFEEINRKILRSLTTAGGDPGSWIDGLFELSYLSCYPMIPLGVLALYLAGRSDYVGRYWLVVLLASCVCYAAAPFIQILPPRLVAPQNNHTRSGFVRRVNLWLLDNASIQANTFPSAHVASTLSASLVLIGIVPLAGFIFLGMAMVISVASITGRYHYAIDSLAGAAISVGAYLVMGLVNQP
jgi:hypothetical protein